MISLPKNSFGIGDRFGKQGEPLLKAFLKAKERDIEVSPVFNKSNREHITVNTQPKSVKDEAESAVKALGWDSDYFVDADHITLDTVDGFIPYADFFTIDVAEQIGSLAPKQDIEAYVKRAGEFTGQIEIPGIVSGFSVDEAFIQQMAGKYLLATQKAKEIFDHIKQAKQNEPFAVEVSMDEVEEPQKPLELFFILHMIAYQGIPIDTIAPKFSGRFNKGVDYEGSVASFEEEFENDILIINHAIKTFDLKPSLKLSVHTGSDKFSIYPIINKLIKRYECGVHIKTAGTTWLAEIEALAGCGGPALAFCKEIYKEAYVQYDALTKPYATVINIDRSKLPPTDAIDEWDGETFQRKITHDLNNFDYNPNIRQLMHVGYKLAGQRMKAYLGLLDQYADQVSERVTENIWEKHISKVFL